MKSIKNILVVSLSVFMSLILFAGCGAAPSSQSEELSVPVSEVQSESKNTSSSSTGASSSGGQQAPEIVRSRVMHIAVTQDGVPSGLAPASAAIVQNEEGYEVLIWSDTYVPQIRFVYVNLVENGSGVKFVEDKSAEQFPGFSLEAKTPLSAKILPIGDIGDFGVIVTEEDKSESLYIINISGKDGSISLQKQ